MNLRLYLVRLWGNNRTYHVVVPSYTAEDAVTQGEMLYQGWSDVVRARNVRPLERELTQPEKEVIDREGYVYVQEGGKAIPRSSFDDQLDDQLDDQEGGAQ